MSVGLKHKKSQKVIAALQSATDKIVKELQKGGIVSVLDHFQLCQNAFKDYV